jgi:hypothetical protein
LINAHFVPVYASNEDYRGNGAAPPEERKEHQRIYHEALKAKLSAGTVHVYILSSDGHPIDSQHVATATNVDKMIAMLERTVDRLKLKAGKPLVTPAKQAPAPEAGSDDLVLHLIARNVRRQGDQDVPHRPKLGETRSGNWGAYPAENWIILKKEEWKKLLPGGAAKPGGTWDPDPETAARLLKYFYPSTENNDLRTNRIDRQALRATVVSVKDGVVRARLDGFLKMKHPFYHKDDGNFVEAPLVGLMEFDVKHSRIRSFQLATDAATYRRLTFGVVVASKK